MPTFMLVHRHQPADCPAAYAAWNGFGGSLRGTHGYASCGRLPPAMGSADTARRHEIWWVVEAADGDAALAGLPAHVAERTRAVEVGNIVAGQEIGLGGAAGG